MRSFWRLLGYLRNYRTQVVLNIVSNLLTALFTAIAIPLLQPFLELLFDRKALITEAPAAGFSFKNISDFFGYTISRLIVEQGKEAALVYVCMWIVGVFFFKNLFRYLSLFFMAPVRNGIIRDLRGQLFSKLLVLPLSYFSEERKGDLMSRITADVQEVEWSILNVLEAVFREPLIITGTPVSVNRPWASARTTASPPPTRAWGAGSPFQNRTMPLTVAAASRVTLTVDTESPATPTTRLPFLRPSAVTATAM